MEIYTVNTECCKTIKECQQLTKLDVCLMVCSVTKLKKQYSTQNKESNGKNGERNGLPLYGPDSMMPSVVEAKLLEVTQDSEIFRAPGTLG